MSAFKRLLKKKGEEWSIQRWLEGAKDEYKVTSKTLSTAETVRAIRTEMDAADRWVTVTGEQRRLDLQILVATDVLPAVFLVDIENDAKMAPMATSPSGIQYDILALGREGSLVGTLRLFLSKRRSNA